LPQSYTDEYYQQGRMDCVPCVQVDESEEEVIVQKEPLLASSMSGDLKRRCQPKGLVQTLMEKYDSFLE
jgi:hypothetical protein